jgi:hypothetical protein
MIDPRVYALLLPLCLALSSHAQDRNDRNLPTQANLGTMISVTGLRVPQKAWEHYDRARAAVLAGNESDFTRESSAALKIEPNFAALYVLRATHEIRLNRLQPGLDDVLTARRIEPDVAWSGVTLASAYNSLHRYVEAYFVLANLRAPESTTWQAAYEAARSATGRADVEDALHWSALTLKLAPPSCLEAHLLRANALQLAHRRPEAVHELRLYVAAQTRPNPEILSVITALEREPPELASN